MATATATATATTNNNFFSMVDQPFEQFTQFLSEYGAKVCKTKFENMYIIKFDPQTQAYHPAVNQLRGVIFRVIEGKIYDIHSLGYPVPIEYKDQSVETQESIVSHLKDTCYSVQEALDGTLIRVWYHTESKEWKVSTNSKEDAHDAFWMNGVSFGDLFESTLEGISYNLNPNYVYLFTLCHPMNVIVVNHEKPKIYHLTTIDRITATEVSCDIGVSRPPVLQMTVDEVLNKTRDSQGTPVASAGYVVVPVPNESGIVNRYRFENVNYTKARALRGESNNIEEIILQHLLRVTDSNPDVPLETVPEKLAEFLQYYPMYLLSYNSVLNRINHLVKYIFQVYTQRYKYRQEVMVDPRHHHFIKDLHMELYVNHLRPQRLSMTQKDVMNFIYNQTPKKIAYLIEIL